MTLDDSKDTPSLHPSITSNVKNNSTNKMKSLKQKSKRDKNVLFHFLSVLNIFKFKNLGILNLKKRRNTFYWITEFF